MGAAISGRGSLQENRNVSKSLVAALFLVWSLLSGCQSLPQFPQRPLRLQIQSDGTRMLYFDTNGDGKSDYRQRLDSNGRKVDLFFSAQDDKPAEVVHLNDIDDNSVPHFIIALDGVPFSLVEELYGQGCFRLFYPPSRMVSCFPAMTDLAFPRIFGGAQPVAYQAEYFDREKNKIINGRDIYLSGKAADWAHRLDYRCSFKLDPIAYLHPQLVFDHELRGMMEVFRKATKGTTIAYSVGTAGLGTRGGREAILKYLRTIDQLCEQIVYDRRGRVKISLLADHGQNMSGRGRVTFDKLLKEKGYNLTDHLDKKNDVVTIQLGLITYAAFFTADPAGVANALLEDPVTTVACYPQDDTIVVQTLNGKALIRHKGKNYSYKTLYGDPLELLPIIKQLRQKGLVDAEGFIDDRALLYATIKHIYPDPLRRVWMAFHGIARNPADLIVCIRDGWVHGSQFFNVMIGGASSTHGSLNQVNSVTFLMTMLGPTPAAIRLEDAMPTLAKYNKSIEKLLTK